MSNGFQNIFYFHHDLTTVIKITCSLDSELCQSSRWKLETIWIHIFHMPEMKCWHHPWISARWNNKRPTNTLKVRPNLNRNSNFYVLKKFSNQNIQINPDLWTSKTSLSWETFFADAFVLDMTRTLKIIWKSLNIYGVSNVLCFIIPLVWWRRWGSHKNLWSVCARVHDWLSRRREES